jgi:DNA-binding NarL/FixJ family response regulator
VRAARALSPDLVLMDVVLPGWTAWRPPGLIKNDDAEVVVLLLSTYDLAGFQAQVEACGAAAYVPKSAFGPTCWSTCSGSPPGG